MAITPEKEAQLKSYVSKALDQGFSLTVVEQKLRTAGYTDADIAQISRAFTKPMKEVQGDKKFWLIVFGIAIAVAAVLALWQFAGTAICAAEDCFMETANRCGTATYQVQQEGSSIEHHVEDCTYTRTMRKVSTDEPEEVRPLMEGKSLTCTYVRGEFNTQWTSTISLGLEPCNGPLKDSIEAIINAQQEIGLIGDQQWQSNRTTG